MKNWLRKWLVAFVVWCCCTPAAAQEIAISYPGLSGESSSLWIAREGGFFKENGVDAKLIYMEGGRLSIQSLLSGHTQFMAGDAVSALSAVGAGADIVLLASAKNILPYVFAVAKQVKRIQDLKSKIVGISQIGGRAGEIARMVIKNNGLDPDKDVTDSRSKRSQYYRSRADPADHRCALDDANIRRGKSGPDLSSRARIRRRRCGDCE